MPVALHASKVSVGVGDSVSSGGNVAMATAGGSGCGRALVAIPPMMTPPPIITAITMAIPKIINPPHPPGWAGKRSKSG